MKTLFPALVMFALLWSITACDAPKQPEFKELINLKFNSLKKGVVTLTADAVFNNPNPFGIQLTSTDLNLLLDGKKAANVQQSIDIKVPASQGFKVPINININPKDLSANLLLDGALTMFNNKKIPMRLNGTVTVKVLELEFKIPVNYEQPVSLKEFL